MWWIALVLIILGIFSVIRGMEVEGIEAPMPTKTGCVLFWAGIVAIISGLIVAVWRLAIDMGYWLSHG